VMATLIHLEEKATSTGSPTRTRSPAGVRWHLL